MPISTIGQMQAQLARLDQMSATDNMDFNEIYGIAGEFAKMAVAEFNISKKKDASQLKNLLESYAIMRASKMHEDVTPEVMTEYLQTQKLNPLEFAALAYYSNYGYHAMNQAIRAEASGQPLSPAVFRFRDCLDSAIAKCQGDPVFTQFQKTYRGMTTAKLFEQKWEGDTYVEPAYGSTSKDPLIARKFMFNPDSTKVQDDGALLVVHGRNAVNMRNASAFPHEEEHLTPRNSEYRILLKDTTQTIQRLENGVYKTVPITTIVAEEADLPALHGYLGEAYAMADYEALPHEEVSLANALTDKPLPK